MPMPNTIDLFINWNKVLYSYFFENQENEECEVSLYIDREKIDELGNNAGLGNYEDSFLRVIKLSREERQYLYTELRRTYIGTRRPDIYGNKYRSSNLFDFATIFIDTDFYRYLKYPFLIYIVFIVVTASEYDRNNGTRRGFGNHIIKLLKEFFPGHPAIRESWADLFEELAEREPRFCARKLTQHPYVGLVYYQLGLSRSQVNILEKAMYNADLSEDLPFNIWIDYIKDYVDDNMRALLSKAINDEVLKRRISDLREQFDPTVYEQRDQEENITSKGKFVLAVYEDSEDSEEDRLVLLTDINNQSISDGTLRIRKGTIDRLGKYNEFNVNPVLIRGCEKAQMKCYSLRDKNNNNVRSETLGDIVIFERCGNNYLIQTKYPERGRETYILVRKSSDERNWQEWCKKQGSPDVKKMSPERIQQIFGDRWDAFISNEIEYKGRLRNTNNLTNITMEGGIKCEGMHNVYLRTALPYFEFPEPINIERLKILIGIGDRYLENDEYAYRIINNNRIIFDLLTSEIADHSENLIIHLEYKIGNRKIETREEFSVIGQDVFYAEDKLFKMNMWGGITEDEDAPYLKGLQVHNAAELKALPEGCGFYQNRSVDLDIHDRRFYLVNLFTAECSMSKGFSITETKLQKCIRYAATRNNIDIASESTFKTNVKYLLLNSGYMNADFEHQKYQPVPPTFIKTILAFEPGNNLFMLVGSYTQKFLFDLKMYCLEKFVDVYVHSKNNGLSDSERLIPPIILLGHNFDPNDFNNYTDSKYSYYGNEDIAINILKAIPSYADYGKTLDHVSSDVFGTSLEEPDSSEFPRVRESERTGYGSSKWIEKKENEFYRITLPDMAWATLYCLYNKEKVICTKDINKLMLPAKMHLPVMMQRALYIQNLGVPKKEKAFICKNDDRTDVFYNIIKRYDIQETNALTRISPAIHAITGRVDNEQNTSVRHRFHSNRYKLFFWQNKNKASKSPRSMIVLTDILGNNIYGIGIKKKTFAIYLRDYTNGDTPRFRMIDNNNLNEVFSTIISSNWVEDRLKYILSDTEKVSREINVNFVNTKYLQLPARNEYEIEEIIII